MKVCIIAALTADGFIAKHHNQLINWTSPEDKKHYRHFTSQAGNMVMGARTFATMGKALPGRRTIVYTTDPANFSAPDVEPTNESPAALIERLSKEGVTTLAICGGASIYSLFMEAGVVDELYLTIEPILFGTGVSLLARDTETRLTLIESTHLNDDTILQHYRVASQTS